MRATAGARGKACASGEGRYVLCVQTVWLRWQPPERTLRSFLSRPDSRWQTLVGRFRCWAASRHGGLAQVFAPCKPRRASNARLASPFGAGNNANGAERVAEHDNAGMKPGGGSGYVSMNRYVNGSAYTTHPRHHVVRRPDCIPRSTSLPSTYSSAKTSAPNGSVCACM